MWNLFQIEFSRRQFVPTVDRIIVLYHPPQQPQKDVKKEIYLSVKIVEKQAGLEKGQSPSSCTIRQWVTSMDDL